MSGLNEFMHQREILKQLRRTCASGGTSLAVEFDRLLEFDIELARNLFYQPNEFFKEANGILEQITKILGMRLAVRGLDKTLAVDDLRANHIDKFIEIRGTTTMLGFNKLIRVEGYGETKEFDDFQRLLIDDCLTVVLKGDLVGTVKEGESATITGILGAVNEGSVYGYALVANHIEVNGHAPGPREPSPHDFGEGSDGPGADKEKREV